VDQVAKFCPFGFELLPSTQIFHVRDGMLDLPAVRPCLCVEDFEIVANSVDGDKCSLAALLLALQRRHGRSLAFPQLVAQLAGIIDTSLCCLARGDQDGRPWWSKAVKLNALFDIDSLDSRQRSSHLWKYAQETGQALVGENFLSIVVDDSRCGRKAAKIIAAVLPQNVAFWLAPQVLYSSENKTQQPRLSPNKTETIHGGGVGGDTFTKLEISFTKSEFGLNPYGVAGTERFTKCVIF
jgi:hypothetical protein